MLNNESELSSEAGACTGQTFCAAYGNAVNDPTKHPERTWPCYSQGVCRDGWNLAATMISFQLFCILEVRGMGRLESGC